MADKRYIDADKLTYSRVRIIHSDGTMGGWNAVVMSSEINNAPAADVVEVRHGEWENFGIVTALKDTYVPVVRCSKCKIAFGDLINEHRYVYRYCPYCGAKMGGEREDKP